MVARVKTLSIAIRHLRNIERLDWQPPAGLSLIWGDNGHGKTTLLEAVHLALTGRSFRTRRDEEMLPWQGHPDDVTRSEIEIEGRTGRNRLAVTLVRTAREGASKRAFADGQWLTRLADLWGRAAVVTFTPDDVDLMKGPPAGRRRFLDMLLAQASHPYLEWLQRYQQALRQLSALYKTRPPERDVRAEAQAFWQPLAEAGAALSQARAARLAEAAPALAEHYAALGGADEARLAYDPDIAPPDGLDAADPAARPALASHHLALLEANYPESRRQGLCTIGPHRDDFSLLLAGHDLRRFGSQGQHRLAALALRLEGALALERLADEPPILLLDDFGSELDPRRREAVLARLAGSMQVLVTATTPADFGPRAGFEAAIRVREGRLEGFSAS